MNIGTIFKPNEIVQALDDTTSIWEEVKVLGIESDWSVRVKWTSYTSPVLITVPENLRTMGSEHWNIRKSQKIDGSDTGRRTRRRIIDPAIKPPGNPAKLARYEKVSLLL